MPRVDAVVECPVHDSFRVQQAAGLFDVPLGDRASERFSVELPELDEDWQIGLIVGPSGSGKTTIARQVYGERLFEAAAWPADRAVVDAFAPLSVRETVGLFTAVGFSSPPSWVKPYRVLSRGEQFRCDLARSLAAADPNESASTKSPIRNPQSEIPLVVFDEFTSVVDRNVARVCSAAVAKAIRGGRVRKRFVAVTCHYDVAEWLTPDWTLDMADCRLARGCLRRPSIRLEVHRCRLEAWRLFARHHYLTGSLAPQARCYLATWDGDPVAFCATLPVIGRKGHRRFTRIVTLPDYQGIGIGSRVVEAVAQAHRDERLRISVTSSHPALIQHCKASPRWRTSNVKRNRQRRAGTHLHPNYRDCSGRMVVSFEYVGPTAGAVG